MSRSQKSLKTACSDGKNGGKAAAHGRKLCTRGVMGRRVKTGTLPRAGAE